MSTSTSLSSRPASDAGSPQRARSRHRFRPIRLGLLLLFVLVVALFVPDSFRFLAKVLISFEAWRAGVSTHIGAVEGSILEPVTLRDTVWIYESDSGPVTRVEIQSARIEFDWHNLLPRSTGHVFQRLSLRGVNGKIQFPLAVSTTTPARRESFRWRIPRPDGSWLPAPERIEAADVDFIFQSNHDFVRLADTDFTLSGVEAGSIHAGQVVLKQPWINRTFHNVRGTTAIQDAKVEIANFSLDPDAQIRSFSAELDDLARGRLNLEMQVAAFGGSIRVAAQALSEERPLAFEATGTFSQIGLAKLAAFLGYTDAAGGTIKEGKFTFRGPPQQISQATASLRFEATNFQWDSRQWDSLVLGATLVNGRVQLPELALAQGHNRLNLSGEMPIPVAGTEWWQTDFDLNIAAKIENLTELSALMLPEFQYAAGKANIDGSIRGKGQQFHGQLIVSGSNLKWHNAPIEELHAGVKLNGNEFQITNVSLFNNGDYLRGHGVVNILGDKQYWGEFHASIEDLAKYAAILQKPIVPEPLAGGAVIDWSGEGSAKGHSGQFSARLRKLRSIGATATLLHPINADFEGNYAPGMMQFSRFMLSDDNSSFTANVGIGNKALSLQGIRLYNRQALWLEGDALLPLDVWNAWPNTTLATLLDDHTVGKVNLTAYNLELGEASLLLGWKFPIQGVVRGNLVAEGPLHALKTSGKLSLAKGQIPIGWTGELLTAVEGEASLEGQSLRVAKFTGRDASGDFSATGALDFTNFRDPTLKLDVASAKAMVEMFGKGSAASDVTGSAKLQVAGPASAALVSGEIQASALILSPEAEPQGAACFFQNRATSLPPAFNLGDAPWNAWKFNLKVLTSQPVPVHIKGSPAAATDGNAELNLHLSGTGNDPALTGAITFRGQTLSCGATILHVTEASLSFREGFSRDPSVTARAEGLAMGERFETFAVGTLQHPMRYFGYSPPLTEKIISQVLSGNHDGGTWENVRMGLRVPGDLYDGVEIVDWPAIPTPLPQTTAPLTPPATPAPAVSPAPAPAPSTNGAPTPSPSPNQ